MNAWTTSEMNACPTRTSPCGCSSPDVGLILDLGDIPASDYFPLLVGNYILGGGGFRTPADCTTELERAGFGGMGAAIELMERYSGILAKGFEPADARYLANHRGHLMKVKDVERPFVTGEMIRETTFTGTEGRPAWAHRGAAGWRLHSVHDPAYAGARGCDRGLGAAEGGALRVL